MENTPIPHQVIGQKITKIWRGYAGVIFLELGKLSKGDYFSQKGEFTIMVEGYWLIRKENIELLDVAKSSYKEIDKVLKRLVGLELESAQFEKSNKDLVFQIGKEYYLIMSGLKDQRLTIFNKSKILFEFGE